MEKKMTIIEEKRNILINRINQTEDEDLLDMMNNISSNILNLHPVIGQLVEDSLEQIENGEYYTHDEMKEKVKSWV
jgi:hypothetical protein